MRWLLNRPFTLLRFSVIVFLSLILTFTPNLAKDTNEIVAFIAGRYSENKDIYIVDINSSHKPVKLTNNGNNFAFSWSPDGRHIAFISNRDQVQNFQIYMMDADGSNQIRLTTTGNNLFPSWSPDGKHILFASQNQSGGNNQISSIDITDNRSRQLTNLSCNSTYSAWSPDGKYIAFVCHFGESQHQIYIMDSNGDNVVGLYDKGYIEDFLSWSPNSLSITFLSTGENYTSGRQIYSIGIKGANLIQLTDSGNNSSPIWSSDGKHIVFASFFDGFSQIFVMDADGSAKTRLTTLGDNRSPMWSVNGELITFVSGRDGHWQIYVMNVDGSNQIRITDPDNDVDNESPAWMPTPSTEITLS